MVVAPTTQRSIGDVLTAHNISWKYYGGGFNVAGTNSPLAVYCEICNPFEYEANYPTMVSGHMRDVTDLFEDLRNGTPPSVSSVKPDGYVDGHPGYSKWSLFEAFVRKVVQLAQSNQQQWAGTATCSTSLDGRLPARATRVPGSAPSWRRPSSPLLQRANRARRGARTRMAAPGCLPCALPAARSDRCRVTSGSWRPPASSARASGPHGA